MSAQAAESVRLISALHFGGLSLGGREIAMSFSGSQAIRDPEPLLRPTNLGLLGLLGLLAESRGRMLASLYHARQRTIGFVSRHRLHVLHQQE